MHDRDTEGFVLRVLAAVRLRQDRGAEARVAVRAGETLLRETGDGSELGMLLAVKAEIALADGDRELAHASIEEAASLATELAAGPGSDLGAAVARVRPRVAG